MAKQSALEGSKRKKPTANPPTANPGDELAERDLDKVSGGVNTQTTKTPPSGPIPIPYPNQA